MSLPAGSANSLRNCAATAQPSHPGGMLAVDDAASHAELRSQSVLLSKPVEKELLALMCRAAISTDQSYVVSLFSEIPSGSGTCPTARKSLSQILCKMTATSWHTATL